MSRYTGSNASKSTAVAQPKPVPALAMPPGFGNQQEWVGFRDNIARAHASGLLPTNIKTPEQALVIALKGRELGLEPLYALSVLHLINGKIGMSAEVMRALVYRKYPKAEILYVTPSGKRNEECTIKARRDGEPDYQEFTFTIEDAKRANLLSKENWRMYPADMLMSRATSKTVRQKWPECIMGCYTDEELRNSVSALHETNAAEIDSRFVETEAVPPPVEEPEVAEVAVGEIYPEEAEEADDEAFPQCECGTTMQVSKKNSADWHCYRSAGGCGRTVPRL